MFRNLPGLVLGVMFLALLLAADSPEVMKLKGDLQQASKIIDKLQADLKVKDRDSDKNKSDLVKALQELRDKDALLLKLQQQVKANEKIAIDLAAKEKELDKSLRETARTKFDLDKHKEDLKKSQDDLKKTQKDFDTLKNAPYVHKVVIHLKKDAPAEQVDAMIKDTHELLGKIGSVRGYWVGKPAEKGSPEFAVTDFQLGLVLLFDDFAGLGKYLDDPKHKEFVEKHGKHWEKATVYDVAHQKAK